MPIEIDLGLIGQACDRATQLSVEKQDNEVALALCLDMRDPSLVEIIHPACELAGEDALVKQDLR